MIDEVNILYVEDCESDVELLKMSIDRYCSSLNIVFTIAETVEEAKELFDINKHVMALVDCNLPDGEGIDIVKYIRERHEKFPVFLLSGIITTEHIKAAELYNATGCFEKDYNKSFINSIVSQLNSLTDI
jgi:response regulator of citrate/malate metabolism